MFSMHSHPTITTTPTTTTIKTTPTTATAFH
jgi:hypothetical protein